MAGTMPDLPCRKKGFLFAYRLKPACAIRQMVAAQAKDGILKTNTLRNINIHRLSLMTEVIRRGTAFNEADMCRLNAHKIAVTALSANKGNDPWKNKNRVGIRQTDKAQTVKYVQKRLSLCVVIPCNPKPVANNIMGRNSYLSGMTRHKADPHSAKLNTTAMPPREDMF